MKLAPPVVAALTLAASGALLAGPAAAATQAAATTHTKVISSCVKATYRPRAYVLACADDNTAIRHATYSTWTRHSASGHGTYYYNTCTPDCVDGKTKHHPVSFILSRVRTVDGTRLFTRINVSYAGLSENFSLPTTTE
jgi:hypothetical protein